MIRDALPNAVLKGGQGVSDAVAAAIRQIGGFSVSPVTGATIGSKMTLASIRPGDLIIAAIMPATVVTVAVPEIHHIAVDATSGAFSVTWNGQTTTPLAFNVSGADFTTALEALSNINPGDVVVTGGPGVSGGGTPYILTWNATLGNVAAPTTTVTGTGTTLSGGASTAAVTTSQAGVNQVSGGLLNDADNITIQSCKASGTLTFATAIEGNTFNVNGVTYTVTETPASATDVDLNDENGDPRSDTEMAAAAAAAINDYEARYLGGLGSQDGSQASGWNNGSVFAEASGTVVTVTAIEEGPGNAPVVTGTTTRFGITNSNTADVSVVPNAVVATNTLVVNGVTFTARVAPASEVEFATKGTDALTATEVARAINAYEFTNETLDVVATVSGTTVHLKPRTGKKGNIIVLTGTVTTLAASGSGTLANGTNTGGIKSTTDLTGKALLVFWYDLK